ncbi:MAG: choice-of-anchor D domain-containing protein [Candidatus Marithrix sp.]
MKMCFKFKHLILMMGLLISISSQIVIAKATYYFDGGENIKIETNNWGGTSFNLVGVINNGNEVSFEVSKKDQNKIFENKGKIYLKVQDPIYPICKPSAVNRKTTAMYLYDEEGEPYVRPQSKNMVTLGLHDLHKPEYHAISYPKDFCAYYKSDDKKAYTWTGLIRIHYANMAIEPQTTSNWNVKVGDTNTRTFIFHNTGDADLYDINLRPSIAEYRIVGNNCTDTVKSGGKCEFKIAFYPNQVGEKIGLLGFSANAQGGKQLDEEYFQFSAFGIEEQYTLTINPPTGITVITSDAKILCGTTCSSETFEEGYVVNLLSSNKEGQWTGDCEYSTNDTCTITMDSDKTVSAEFDDAEYRLFINPPIDVVINDVFLGRVKDCNSENKANCDVRYKSGETVWLEAKITSNNKIFEKWQGVNCVNYDVSIKHTCQFEINKTTMVTPVLSEKDSPPTQDTSFACSKVTEIPIEECKDLVSLYDSTNGDNWNDGDNTRRLTNTDWKKTNNPCSWENVTCRNGHVVIISKSQQNLIGNIPELNFLTYLEKLILSKNNLTGKIPSFKALIKLERLSFHENNLSGNLPDFSGLNNLQDIMVNDNPLLEGPLPNSLISLSSLEYLDFRNTNLCEPQDTNFQNWLNSFSSLYLLSNNISCAVPEIFIPKLSVTPLSLELDDNHLSGLITIANSGTGILNNIRVTVDGTDAENFSVHSTTNDPRDKYCENKELETGQSCSIAVRFKVPDDLNLKTASINIASNGGSQEVALVGVKT